MLGPDNLQANRYPYVRIHSLGIGGEAPNFSAKLSIEMHGQTREMWVPLTVTGLPDVINIHGSFVLRQTDFGVKPYSVLGGLITVQDELIVDFTLAGQ
jgi:polyisoprenoid-binding protein YceI